MRGLYSPRLEQSSAQRKSCIGHICFHHWRQSLFWRRWPPVGTHQAGRLCPTIPLQRPPRWCPTYGPALESNANDYIAFLKSWFQGAVPEIDSVDIVRYAFSAGDKTADLAAEKLISGNEAFCTQNGGKIVQDPAALDVCRAGRKGHRASLGAGIPLVAGAARDAAVHRRIGGLDVAPERSAASPTTGASSTPCPATASAATCCCPRARVST